MNTVPNELKKLFQQIVTVQQFTSNIAYYTKVAYELVTNAQNQEINSGKQELECPTAYLLLVTHFIQNSIPLEVLAQQFPEQYQKDYLKAIKALEKKNSSTEGKLTEIVNNKQGELIDVKWSMAIENGREVWDVELYIDKKPEPISMRLNYEELSLLSFKVNQLVGHIKSLDLESNV